MAGQQTRIGIKITGLNKALAALKAAKREAAKKEPLYKRAIVILEMSHMKTFRMGGRPRWKVSERAALQSGKTLMDTGRLRNSVTASTSRHAIREHEGNKLAFGTKLLYARSHQYGLPSRGIPIRKFLGVYPEDIKRMEKEFGDDLEGRFKVVTVG